MKINMGGIVLKTVGKSTEFILELNVFFRMFVLGLIFGCDSGIWIAPTATG